MTTLSESVIPDQNHAVSYCTDVGRTLDVHSHENSDSFRGPPLDHHHFRDDALRFNARAAFTNDNAILDENELSIGIQPEFTRNAPKPKITQSHIERGVMVLSMFKDFPAIQRCLEKFFSYGGGFLFIKPVMRIYVSGIWTVWQKTIEAQKPEGLKNMSETIWGNTLQPLSRLFDEHTRPRDFHMSVTGEGLRWEVIGIIVSMVSIFTQSMKGSYLFAS